MTFIGLCDTEMFPGTDQFVRFVYPSRVPAQVQKRMRGLAERLPTGMGYRHGFFNIEMIWNPAGERIMPIELCTGAAPRVTQERTRCRVAASLVSRRFDGRPLEREPCAVEVADVRRRFPDAAIMLYLKRGQALAREMNWPGSYRYAVVNLGGANEEALNLRYAEIRRMLQFSQEA